MKQQGRAATHGINAGSRAGRTALILAFLAATAWAAHFSLSRDFLLYEDDFYHVGARLDSTWSEIAAFAKWCFHHLPQGRPLHFLLMPVATFAAMHLGGLGWVYFFAYCFVAANAMLCFLVLKKTVPEKAALAGALAFCLFPADASHALLTHMALQASLAFLLTASLAYLSERKILACVLVLGTLATYETALFPFLAVPLLQRPWNRRTLKDMGFLAVFLAAAAFAAGMIRLAVGEVYVLKLAGENPGVNLIHGLAAMVLGPAVAAWAFVLRPFSALKDLNAFMLGVLVLFFPAAWFGLHLLSLGIGGTTATTYVTIKNRMLNLSGALRYPRTAPDSLKVLTAGLLALSLAYTLTFPHWPPTPMQGRQTCVHTAAAYGASLCFAALAWMLFEAGRFYNRKKLAAGILALHLALLAGFAVAVQQDLVKSAREQRAFWQEVVRLCPDMENGTRIFVYEKTPANTTEIRSFSWLTCFVLEEMFSFPKDWSMPPALLMVNDANVKSLRRDSTTGVYKIALAEAVWNTVEAPPNEVIYLECGPSGLIRKQGAVENGPLAGIALKPQGPSTLEQFSKRPLHSLMMGEKAP